MAAVSFTVATLAILVLYEAAFAEARTRLVGTVTSQDSLIEAVARFDSVHSRQDHPEGWRAATLGQVLDAYKRSGGFGATGEFVIAERRADRIFFLSTPRHSDIPQIEPVSISGRLGEPMRRALAGKSGTMIGIDYRGEPVLAAYEPVAVIELGLVAKIDLTEIRAPFIRAGLLTAGAAVVVVILGAILFLRVSTPLIDRLMESAARNRAILDTAPVE